MAPLSYEGPKRSSPVTPTPTPSPSPGRGPGGGDFGGGGSAPGGYMSSLGQGIRNAMAAIAANSQSGDSYYTARVPTWGPPSGIAPNYQGASNANTMANAISSFWTDSDAQARIRAAANRVYGYNVNSVMALALWKDLLAESQVTGRPAWNIINNINNGTFSMGTDPSGGGPGGGGGYGGGGGGGSTTTQVQLTNPDTAKGLVNNAMANALGRQATEKEFNSFLTALNEAEKSNPIVSTVTATGSGSSVEVSGGVNPTQIAQEYAESRPDYAEFQAATNLMDAFIATLDDPVEL